MNEGIKTKKSLLFRIGLFSKNHPVLLFAVLAGCFLLAPSLYPARAGGFWDIFGTTVGDAIRAALYGIYQFCSSLVTIAAALFTWVIDAKTFTSLMNDGAIYEVWVIIRDFCNIFFILVLLFSAFATIFQLDKYEYKKTIPMLVLMALLVNFSFPISRVVIDLANVPMYFFAQNVFGTGVKDISSGILKASTVSDIILPGSSNASSDTYSFSQLLTAIVCMFLLGISFFVLAILMLVRMIALVILVMFSPIGFVGLITPALQGTAKGWWDKLFKWAFYGPISVMFVLIAIIVMQTANKVHTATNPMKPLVGNTVDDNFIATIAYFAVPIVLFWIAITSAEKYSSEMSGMSIKWGSNFGRKVGGWMRKGTWGATGGAAIGLGRYGWKQSGVPGGVKTWWNERTGWFSPKASQRWREENEARLSGALSWNRKGAMDALDRKQTHEGVEENKKTNKPYKKLIEEIEEGNKRGASRADKIKARAAALTMSEKELFENADDFGNALKAAGNDMDSVSRIIRKAPKDILLNADDLVKTLAAVNTATSGDGWSEKARAQMKKQVIEKTDSGTLAEINGEQYGKIMASFAKTEGGAIDEGLKGAFNAKMKKEGKVKAIIDHEYNQKISANPGWSDEQRHESKRNLYYEKFKDYNAEDIGKQSNAELMGDVDFQKFFKQKLKDDPRREDFYRDYLKHAKSEKRAEFIGAMEEEDMDTPPQGMP